MIRLSVRLSACLLASAVFAGAQVNVWYFRNANTQADSAHGSNVLAVTRVGFNDDSEPEWGGMGDMDLVIHYRTSSGAWALRRTVELRAPRS